MSKYGVLRKLKHIFQGAKLVISYGLEAINPYNGHQRRERKGESEEQERGAKMVILYGLEAINPL